MRNFSCRTVDDFDERWEERTFDLARLNGLDVFLIDWGAPLVNQEAQRREVLAVAGVLRTYELVYVAATESAAAAPAPGTIDSSQPFAELKAMSYINPRAHAVRPGEDYSAAIREGLPMPPLEK